MNNTGSLINLTPEQARVHANTLETISEDIRNVNSMLKNMAEVTLAPWQGKAKTEFITAFETFEPSLQQASSVLKTISMKLNSTAAIVERLDGRN